VCVASGSARFIASGETVDFNLLEREGGGGWVHEWWSFYHRGDCSRDGFAHSSLGRAVRDMRILSLQESTRWRACEALEWNCLLAVPLLAVFSLDRVNLI
jgi:hypothetical protein